MMSLTFTYVARVVRNFFFDPDRRAFVSDWGWFQAGR